MKKIQVIPLILCILLSALLLTGCATGNSSLQSNTPGESSTDSVLENYEAQILDFSDSVSAGKLTTEYNLTDKTSYAERIKGEPIEVVFKGKKIKGNFTSMGYSSYEFFPLYVYEDENHNSFFVNPKDQVVGYLWFNNPSDSLGTFETSDPSSTPTSTAMSTKEKISEEECIKKAKAFVADGIANPDTYTLSIEAFDSSQEYIVTFQKYIGNVKTTEYINVTITYSGDLYSFRAMMFEQIPNNAKCDFDVTKANETVTKRLDEAFMEAKNIYDEVTYNFDEPMLTVLKDGRYAMYCSVMVECTEQLARVDENGETISRLDTQRERITFIVTK